MSSLRTESPVVAICCGDLHFSHKAPSARAEQDWFSVMENYLGQLRTLADKWGIPIIVAGDVFDRWNSNVELVNFLLDVMPHCYGIPGQHDLPFHILKDIKKSAYWTLVKSKRITNLEHGKPKWIQGVNLVLHGFPWGTKLTPRNNLAGDGGTALHIAVVHHYCWINGKGYPQASREDRAVNLVSQLPGYDVIITSDNHQSFIVRCKNESKKSPRLQRVL